MSIEFKGITISLYPNNRGTWEAGFTVPGIGRDKATGTSEATCRENAREKIRKLMGTEDYAARTDEETARQLLKEAGASLTEAARYWLGQHQQPIHKGTVSEIRAIWLDKRGAKKNDRQYHHCRSLMHRSKHLLPRFGDRQISQITSLELTHWLDEIEESVASRTARNIYDAGKDLWKFARKRGYLVPERTTAFAEIDRPKAGSGTREIYTPEEMQRLLDAAWETASIGAIPMALNAFGSVRAEEVCCHDPEEPLGNRVAYEDINYAGNFIFVRKEVSKTDQERRAGLPKNLKEILQKRRGKGAIYTTTRLDAAYQKIARRAGVKWKHNGLRHSCLTYDMLIAPNATEVANRAGNSVQIIEASYRNRNATKPQAKKWFSLKPRVAWGSAL